MNFVQCYVLRIKNFQLINQNFYQILKHTIAPPGTSETFQPVHTRVIFMAAYQFLVKINMVRRGFKLLEYIPRTFSANIFKQNISFLVFKLNSVHSTT